MSAREHILRKVRAARRTGPEVKSWPFPPQRAEMADQFSRALKAAQGEVFIAESLEDAWSTLASVLRNLKANRVVYNAEPPFDGTILAGIYPQCEWTKVGENTELTRQACETADVGLTGAMFGLAETGTVGIAGGRSTSRLVSLLPEVHLVLLDQALLVPDLIAWEQIRPKQLPAQLVLVSGPSKTADIEQTLVVGAHGPKRMMVILFGS